MIRTLPLDTSLQVTDRRGEWLHVTVTGDGTEGWVHSDYTRTDLPKTSTQAQSFFSPEALLVFFVLGSILGAFIFTGYVAPKLNSAISGKRLIALSMLCVALGVVILLNQFGPLLADLTFNYLDLGKLSPLWQINNSVGTWAKYSHLILLLIALAAAVAAVAPTDGGCRTSFLQGTLTGFLALPALVLVVAVATLAFFILQWIFKAISWILGIIFIPIRWIAEHVLEPVLRFLAIPFVWLWENGLRDLLVFLGTPFVWLWTNLIHPVLGFAFRFLVKPLLLFALGIVASLVALLPFGVVGAIAIESLRGAVRSPMNAVGLFAHGIAIGFLLFDATLLASLASFDLIQPMPPLSLIIPLAPQVIVFFRLLVPARLAEEVDCPGFRDKLTSYWRTSRLDLLATCVIVPLGVLAMLFYGDDS